MWNVSCLESQISHVEDRARDRILRDARIYQEPLTEDEAKEKVLEVMESCSNKDYVGIDHETLLPKYWLRAPLPESFNIFIHLCVVEDEDKKFRKIKTLHTNFDELDPNWRR